VEDASFALLLTHDVDRPYKTYQSLYYAITGGGSASRRYHLSSLLSSVNPYWQFDRIASIEDELGVRSAFYFLSEQSLFQDRPPREWATMEGWMLYAGRYELDDPHIQDQIERLDAGGWEVGLHGSYESYRDAERLAAEKAELEAVLGHSVRGGRQHHLNLEVPETWRRHRDLGLRYDSSLGSSDEYGFQHGHGVVRPFDDEFVVFPLTIMEQSLPDPGADFEAAWDACLDVLHEAREQTAVATVLWHPRHFSRHDFPEYTRLYRRLIEHALEAGAWVGPPDEFYDEAGLATSDDGIGDLGRNQR
jgi:hypothetical protein